MNLPTSLATVLASSWMLVAAAHAQPAVSTPPAAQAAHVPAAQAPATASAKKGKLVIQGFAAPLPATWVATAPSSSMRVAQYAVPAAKGAEAGELAVFFFQPRQGGSHDANIGRWASQFSGADGKPVAPKVTTENSGATQVTLVELRGTYARGVGVGQAGDARPNQTLLVAMVETNIGRITLQMYGPSETMSAQRSNFLKLAKGFRPA